MRQIEANPSVHAEYVSLMLPSKSEMQLITSHVHHRLIRPFKAECYTTKVSALWTQLGLIMFVHSSPLTGIMTVLYESLTPSCISSLTCVGETCDQYVYIFMHTAHWELGGYFTDLSFPGAQTQPDLVSRKSHSGCRYTV